MKPSLWLVCPKCGEKFPFWMWSSSRVRNGLFSNPWFKCAHCGSLSRVGISWPHALWAWPLGFFVIISIIELFHNADSLVALHRHNPGIYGMLAGLSAAPFFVIIRIGMKLVPLQGEAETRSIWILKTCIKSLLVVGVVVGVALVTHRWIATLASFAVCLVISVACHYLFSRKNDEKSVGQKPAP